MNDHRNDLIDRAIEEALASMVAGEPRRVSAASIRQAMGEGQRSTFPIWLAAAAVLIVGLGVALKARPPVAEGPGRVARFHPAPAPVEARSTPSSDTSQGTGLATGHSMTPRRLAVAAVTEPAYEGLPRLIIASIGLPEPLVTPRLDSDPLEIPGIDIAPLSLSGLSPEQENK